MPTAETAVDDSLFRTVAATLFPCHAYHRQEVTATLLASLVALLTRELTGATLPRARYRQTLRA